MPSASFARATSLCFSRQRRLDASLSCFRRARGRWDAFRSRFSIWRRLLPVLLSIDAEMVGCFSLFLFNGRRDGRMLLSHFSKRGQSYRCQPLVFSCYLEAVKVLPHRIRFPAPTFLRLHSLMSIAANTNKDTSKVRRLRPKERVNTPSAQVPLQIIRMASPWK